MKVEVGPLQSRKCFVRGSSNFWQKWVQRCYFRPTIHLTQYPCQQWYFPQDSSSLSVSISEWNFSGVFFLRGRVEFLFCLCKHQHPYTEISTVHCSVRSYYVASRWWVLSLQKRLLVPKRMISHHAIIPFPGIPVRKTHGLFFIQFSVSW